MSQTCPDLMLQQDPPGHTAAAMDPSGSTTSKRRRVTALVTQRRFERLEQLALRSGQPVSVIAAAILESVLAEADGDAGTSDSASTEFDTRSASQDNHPPTEHEQNDQ